MAEAASVYPILQLGAVEQRDRLASGALRAVELAGACLEEIRRREPEVGAWAYLDGDHVMQQARKLAEHRATGRPIGPLRSAEHTPELQSLMSITSAVFCLKKIIRVLNTPTPMTS